MILCSYWEQFDWVYGALDNPLKGVIRTAIACYLWCKGGADDVGRVVQSCNQGILQI